MKTTCLRLSVTDRCNLNCLYCTPLEKGGFLTHDEVLRYEEMARLTGFFARAGITRVRITGGEPLVKKNIPNLVRMVHDVPGIEEVSLTTNGILLASLAGELKQAGLKRVNISLDTLKTGRYREMTGFDGLDRVQAGIDAALAAGLGPIKLNVVLLKGVNDDEIADFVRLAIERPFIVRFIEFFHTSARSTGYGQHRVSTQDAMRIIEKQFDRLVPDGTIHGNGPAAYYRLEGAQAPVGFISSHSGDFCGSCNRVRLNCAGQVAPCLFSGPLAGLRALLRGGASDDEMVKVIKDVLRVKPEYTQKTRCGREIEMSSIGG
jgi:cyclic pyranopterin phosphate synthase